MKYSIWIQILMLIFKLRGSGDKDRGKSAEEILTKIDKRLNYISSVDKEDEDSKTQIKEIILIIKYF